MVRPPGQHTTPTTNNICYLSQQEGKFTEKPDLPTKKTEKITIFTGPIVSATNLYCCGRTDDWEKPKSLIPIRKDVISVHASIRCINNSKSPECWIWLNRKYFCTYRRSDQHCFLCHKDQKADFRFYPGFGREERNGIWYAHRKNIPTKYFSEVKFNKNV